MLSNTSKYAIRATIYLAVYAAEGNKIGIKKISEDLGIPTPFLGKILQSLARNKILSSTKGPNGGFGMGKKATEINLLEIVEAIDNPDFLHTCLVGPINCHEMKNKCSLHHKFSKIRDDFRELLKNETIENQVAEFRKGKQKISI